MAEGVTEEEILEDWEKIKENMEEVKGGGGGEGEFFWSSGMLEEFFKSLAEKEGYVPLFLFFFIFFLFIFYFFSTFDDDPLFSFNP